MKKILKITSIMGIGTCVKILAGLVRAKFLAWQLGPAGMGIVGQATMYWTYAIQLCSLNIGIGITKEVSESAARGDGERVSRTVNTGYTMQLLASVVFIVAVIPFSLPLSRFVFSDQRYWPYFAGITLVTPFAVFLTGIADPVLYGLRKVPVVTKLVIWYTLLGLGLLIALVSFFKTEGMLTQILIVSVAGCALAYYAVRKNAALAPRPDPAILKERPFRATARGLFEYGFISFIPANVGMFVMLYLRGLFMKQYGVEANGFFQVSYAVSAYYLPFVTNALWGHFYPEMCSLREKEDINRELNQFVRFAIFAAAAIAAGAIIFRRYIILVLFSHRFMEAYDLLAIQAVGDIFLVLFSMFSTALMARRKFAGVLLISTAGYNALLCATYLIMARVPHVDYRSLNLAIAVSNAVIVAAHMIYARIDTGFTVTAKNVSLAVKTAVFVGILLIVPDNTVAAVAGKIALAAAWLALSVTRDEAAHGFDLARSFIKRKTGHAA